MQLSYKTTTGSLIVTSEKELFVIRTKGTDVYAEFDLCIIFDFLRKVMSHKSKNVGHKRRAYQLSGASLYVAMLSDVHRELLRKDLCKFSNNFVIQ